MADLIILNCTTGSRVPTVICPICGKFVVIKEESLPEAVKKNAEKIRLNK